MTDLSKYEIPKLEFVQRKVGKFIEWNCYFFEKHSGAIVLHYRIKKITQEFLEKRDDYYKDYSVRIHVDGISIFGISDDVHQETFDKAESLCQSHYEEFVLSLLRERK